MLDLTYIKHCFLDFDDTLCVHLVHDRVHLDWFTAMFNRDVSFYSDKDFVPLPGMLEFLQTLQTNGVVVYGLTWTDYSFVASTKKLWVDKKYPGLVKDVIGTASREGKVEFLTDYQHMFGCYRDEILLVDDLYTTVNEARDAGFQVMSASEVAARYGRR